MAARTDESQTVEIPLRNPEDRWKQIFHKVCKFNTFMLFYLKICFSFQYDRDKDGYINVKELDDLIQSREYENDIPPHVVEKIHSMADVNSDGRLDLNEFINMIHHPKLQPVFGHLVNRFEK